MFPAENLEPQPHVVARKSALVGYLEQVKPDLSFVLRLEDGREVQGVLRYDWKRTFHGLAGQLVAVLGFNVKKLDDEVVWIEADTIEGFPEEDREFVICAVKTYGIRPGIVRRQTADNGLAAVIGKWPGDETEEEIWAALEELS